MKKFGFALVLGITFLFSASGISAYAFDNNGNSNGNGNGNGRNNDNRDHISAMDMSALGLVAASMTGAGIYLVRRRRSSSR